jgi:chitodextrinase
VKDEVVTYTATVENATGELEYAWQSPTVKSQGARKEKKGTTNKTCGKDDKSRLRSRC